MPRVRKSLWLVAGRRVLGVILGRKEQRGQLTGKLGFGASQMIGVFAQVGNLRERPFETVGSREPARCTAALEGDERGSEVREDVSRGIAGTGCKQSIRGEDTERPTLDLLDIRLAQDANSRSEVRILKAKATQGQWVGTCRCKQSIRGEDTES